MGSSVRKWIHKWTVAGVQRKYRENSWISWNSRTPQNLDKVMVAKGQKRQGESRWSWDELQIAI